jgi:CheY-like chemotaxis protein
MPRILVVEDQADIRRLIRWSLEELQGAEIFEAANGRLGLDAVRALRPDLVLLDVMMPGSRRLPGLRHAAQGAAVRLAAHRDADRARAGRRP